MGTGGRRGGADDDDDDDDRADINTREHVNMFTLRIMTGSRTYQNNSRLCQSLTVGIKVKSVR